MSWNVVAAKVLDDPFGYQSVNAFRDNLIALVSRRAGRTLGGSRHFPNDLCISLRGDIKSKSPGVGPSDVFGYVDVEIDGTNQTGITYQARVHVRVSNALLSITPKIRNMTDSADAGTGAACSATAVDYSGTNQKQTIALTIASGVKVYRLQYTLSNVSYDSWMTGEIESFATA